MKTLTKTFFLISLFIFAFCVVPKVFAAEVFFEADNQSFPQGEEFLLNVFINTDGETLNAIEGRVAFPANLLEARDVRNSDSSINFWIKKPYISQTGYITFSGITPGGVVGSKESIFSIVFRTKRIGEGTVVVDQIKSLLNDGVGTLATSKTQPFRFLISQKGTETPTIIQQVVDLEIPEDFVPTIERDPNIYNGKYFLVFATQDKGSGMANYRVREGEWGQFNITESPHLLKNQLLNSKIFVKAIDKAGNERLVILEAQSKTTGYQNYIIICIILSVAFVVGLLLKRI